MPQHERIILTGASSGIGRALAIEYAKRGARLVLMARREVLLAEVADIVVEHGGQAAMLAVDVTAPDASRRAVELAEREFGGVDTVIINAGSSVPTWVREFSAAKTEYAMEVNYTSAVRMLEAVLPLMLAKEQGRIVAVTSLAAYRGMPGSGAYNASKAALMILMESLRTELRGSGITLTTIAPGFVRTDIVTKNEFRMPFMLDPDDAARRIIRAIDAGRSEYRFPLPTSLLTRLIQILPNPIYDRLLLWVRQTARAR